MAYKAICNEYGSAPALLGAVVPAVVSYAAYKTGLQPDHEAAFIGGISGGIGVVFAIMAEMGAYGAVKICRAGTTRGSRIIQRAQATAFAIPVLFGLAVHGVGITHRHMAGSQSAGFETTGVSGRPTLNAPVAPNRYPAAFVRR